MSTFSYTATIADIDAFADHCLRTTQKRTITISALTSAAIVTAFMYYFLLAQLNSAIASASVAGVLGLVVVWAFPSVLRDERRKTLRRLYAKEFGPRGEAVTLTLTPDALVIRNPAGAATLLWRAVQRFEFTPTYAFLVLGPVNAVCVPLAQLPGSTRQQFEDEVTAYIQLSRRPNPSRPAGDPPTSNVNTSGDEAADPTATALPR